MIRTSTAEGLVPPTGQTCFSSMTRRSLTWSGSGSSPISSRNSVPRLAATKSPGLVCTAVVKAPRTCPKSWLSSSVSGIAPQLSAMNTRSARQLAAWIARAPAKGGDGRLEGRVPGHHDDCHARVEHARSLQQVEAIEARHDEVRQDDVELLRLDTGQGLFSTAGRGHAVALGLKRRVQRV